MNLFSTKSNFPFGSFLQMDMHSHILPGIDDGAPDVESSLLLIDGLIRSGYQSLIATPHIMNDHYPNTRETIQNALDILRKALHDNGYTIPVDAAAEYMIDDNFQQLLEKEDLLTFGDNYLLIETFFQSLPTNFNELLFQMQIKNYRVVLAHPERYHYINKNLIFLEKLKEKGVSLQVNALSFTGYYGKREKDLAERMLDAGLIDFIGTDAHHPRHIKALEENLLSKPVIRKLAHFSNQFT